MRVPLNAPTFAEDEVQAAIEVLRSGMVTMGERCYEFEDKFAKHMGVRNAVFVNSGSSANLLAFFALVNPQCPEKIRLKPGDEILVPAVTWSTTIWPIVQAGCIPVLVDADPKTLQMDLGKARKAISPKTKAICPVHVLGNAVPMKEVLELAKEHGLAVIEDTCEALGTRSYDKFCGTYGDMGTFSFFFSHHITTIEGGMIVTDNDELAELLRALRAHGWSRHLKNRKKVESQYPDIDPRFLFINMGFNVRPTEINAAFGLHQIGKLEKFNQRRVEIAEQWCSALKGLSDKNILHPMKSTQGTRSTWFGFPVMCGSSDIRNRLRVHLEENGIETRPVICGNLARQPAFKMIPHRIAGELSGADQIMDLGLFWGSHPIMTNAEVEYVIDVVAAFGRKL